MSLTLLISSLKNNPEELIDKMHIESDAILVNQCDEESAFSIERESGVVRVFNTTDRGVGVSRNRCIDEAFGDVVLFADDDIVYEKNYADKVLIVFEEHPEAEMILFNIKVCDERRTYINEGFKKLTGFGVGRYPAYSIAVKTDVLKDKNLKFSPLFGGGAKYSNGEDSLFLRECIKKKVKMYSSDVYIAEEIPRTSTWFEGYTEKFFFDRGVLFAYLYGKTAWIWRIRFILIKKEMFTGKIKRKEANRLMKDGIKEGFAEMKRNA